MPLIDIKSRRVRVVESITQKTSTKKKKASGTVDCVIVRHDFRDRTLCVLRTPVLLLCVKSGESLAVVVEKNRRPAARPTTLLGSVSTLAIMMYASGERVEGSSVLIVVLWLEVSDKIGGH